MTVVYFTENTDRKIIGFTSHGHAGYKKRGPDIVCAAISILTINAVNSLDEIAGADLVHSEDQKEGIISVKLKSRPDEKTETIFRSLILGLKGISAEYGSKYCKVTVKEEIQC